MLPKKNRISRKEFPAPRVQGFRVFSPLFTAVFYKNTKETKVSVVVSKKLAKTAVARNTLRRRVYSAVAPVFAAAKPALVVIYPKKEAEKAPFLVLKTELERAFRQVK